MHTEELQYIQKAFETNWVSTVGENIDEVCRLIRERTGSQNAVAVTTGTAALHLAMRLAEIKRGTPVFCSDLTFIASVNPVVYEGGTPILVDSEYETWNMDPAALEKAFELHPEVRHIALVHLFGTPCKFDEIRAACAKHNAVIVEDAAESLGSRYRGRSAGTLGDIGAISFNGNKIITGSAGGVLLTDNDSLARSAQKWSTQSRDDAPWYQHSETGYNYRMSNIIAGVIRGQLQHLDEHIARKKAIYERYQKGLADLPISLNPIGAGSEPNYWLTCMMIDRDAMCAQERTAHETTYVPEHGKSCPTEILETLASINAEGRPIWKPMHAQPLFAENEFITVREVPASDDIFRRGLCLPSDINMTAEQQDQIIETIRRCFD